MKNYKISAPEIKHSLDYSSVLNHQQLEVVTEKNGAMLVIAGAGSGKTRTLTYRVAHLIDRGVSPSSVLLCTFTNKAARDMLSRVKHVISSGAHRVWGGTFHHLANRILREHCSHLGYQEGYSILDRQDAEDLLANCLAKHDANNRSRLMPKPGVIAGLVSYALNTQTPLANVIVKKNPTLVPLTETILSVAREYRKTKLDSNAMDFDDLLTNLNRLMNEFPEIGDLVAERFKHVLVDEYQDTNALQCEIVDRLAGVHKNLCVVGDDAQSIYGFRGAKPDNMFLFKDRWPEAKTFKLETNYRSTPQVLELANRSIAKNRQQLPKTLMATQDDGQLPAQVMVSDVETQAEFIAQRVVELVEEGASLKDIAVLYRAHYHSMELQIELTKREIPFVVRSGVRFFEQAHIKDILAHIQLLENPKDEISWQRIIRLQPRIGRSGALAIWRLIRDASDPLEYALNELNPRDVNSRNRASWQQLLELLGKLRELATTHNVSTLINEILAGGYQDILPGLYSNFESRKEDIEQLALYSDNFSDANSFLSELNLLAEFTSEEIVRAEKPNDYLTLSSVHQAKGLEWKYVFCICLNEGSFPNPRALNEVNGEEEERRLFYVAVTRCRQELYLVIPLVSDRPGQRRVILKPSRFVNEVSAADLVERWSVSCE
jgi:DNA helicase-2/ATP-dependent DNA helicase PcrA